MSDTFHFYLIETNQGQQIMTTHLANPFDTIVSTPHVVPQAVERVISGTRLQCNLNDARKDLLNVQWLLSSARASGIDNDPRIVTLFYRCLDRVWEAQCMAGNTFTR